MKVTYFKIAPISLALALAFPVAVVAPAAPALAEDVKHCIDIEGSEIVNTCGYTIEVIWCVAGQDCDGSFHRSLTLGGYRRYPHGGGPDGYIHYGACRGANTITDARNSYTYFCDG